MIIQCEIKKNLTILTLNENEDYTKNELQQFLSNSGLNFQRSNTSKSNLVGFFNDIKYDIKILNAQNFTNFKSTNNSISNIIDSEKINFIFYFKSLNTNFDNLISFLEYVNTNLNFNEKSSNNLLKIIWTKRKRITMEQNKILEKLKLNFELEYYNINDLLNTQTQINVRNSLNNPQIIKLKKSINNYFDLTTVSIFITIIIVLITPILFLSKFRNHIENDLNNTIFATPKNSIEDSKQQEIANLEENKNDEKEEQFEENYQMANPVTGLLEEVVEANPVQNLEDVNEVLNGNPDNQTGIDNDFELIH